MGAELFVCSKSNRDGTVAVLEIRILLEEGQDLKR